MARIFVEMGNLESAIAVREAATADGHDVEMVESPGDVESRLRPVGEEMALVLTGMLDETVASKVSGVFSGAIPRPPLLAVVPERDPEELRRVALLFDLDEAISAPPDPAEVQVALRNQLDRYRLQVESGIVGRTEAIREALDRILLIAPVNSTVLITGESGTGKELAARAIHLLSPRRSRPFIAMNCAAVPESLLESELFGHEKGAFTGATSRRKGMFELADGGTLLLDEIGEMPPQLQTRFLRVLETRRFMRVGGDVEIQVDVRVIAATNQDLRESARHGTFRRDLYYRLNVLHLELPSLRQRKPDIPILVRHFVHEVSEAHDREFKGLASEAMQILLEYDWPGNVRELRNLVESMVVLAPGSVIRAADIPPEIGPGRGRSLLPISAVGAAGPLEPLAGGDGAVTARIPQMEFIFRTLVEMKMDLEDLRAEFERYRGRHPELTGGAPFIEFPVEPIEVAARDGDGATEPDADESVPSIRLTSDMTMDDVEREAIRVALEEVRGNRRKAAERLGIGERTLYRKLRQYELDT
ncbi:sigma-54 interaction domain-containing protein [Gemmatimonadota bacterium]